MIPSQSIRVMIYPAVICLAVLAHWFMAMSELPLLVATYAPVLCAALLIHLLEQRLPYKKQWLPNKSDLGNDALFMLLVQVVLPKALAFLAAIYLIDWLSTTSWTTGFWPNQLPVALQAVLMLMVADLFRYWLHRAFHEWPFLWSFHAVHHSPQKLYWMNVGRFHPLDKALQFLFDALPFILLGISQEVLALYFVFYAINGFFQHCNINLRLGMLNYVISGPELHRWHHSINYREADKNYGNNLIVWDLLFGTYYLPKDRLVGDLGLLNRNYPKSFVSQMKTPFVNKLDKYRGNKSDE